MLCVVSPPGDHKKVPPPTDGEAVSVADCPVQIVWEFTLTVGEGLTVTVAVLVAEQPDNI